jgi:hypothetical protein
VAGWSPDGSQIVFVSNRDGNFEIYVMDADGTNQTRLTNDAASDDRATWSPDGSQIAFESNRDGNFEIYVMDADGTNQARLTNDPAADSAAAWSPDGSQIAFRSTRDGNNEIYLMNADGSNQINLTIDPAVDEAPAWGAVMTAAADNATPVLVSASSPQSTGSDLFQVEGQTLDLVFSESLGGSISEVNLELALIFGGGASDGDNLPTLGTGANPVSLVTTNETNDTLRVTFNSNNTANADLLRVGVHTVQVSDGTSLVDGATNTANTGGVVVTITGDTNDAPVLDPSGSMTLTDINEDDTNPTGDTVQAIIASATGDRITDADVYPVEGIAVIGVDDTNGTWEYSTDGGGAWNAFGAVTNTAAVLLDAGAMVRFAPDLDYNGPVGDLRFRAWDQTSGGNGQTGVNVSVNGGTTAFSSATETATLNVDPVNDAPSGGPAITGTPTEAQVLTADTSGISDADGLGAFSYQWLRGGVAIGGATVSTYTLGDADVGTQISVEVTYTDGHGTAEGPLTSAQTAAVANVNDAPSLGGGSFAILQNTPDGTQVGVVSGADPDAGDTLSYAIVGGNPGNAFAIDPATGMITVNDTTQIDFATTPIYSLQVQVSDDGTPGLSGTAVVTIGELPVIVSEPPPDEPPPNEPPPDEPPPDEPPPPGDETATPSLPDSSDNSLPVTSAEPVVSVSAEPLDASDDVSERDDSRDGDRPEVAGQRLAGFQLLRSLTDGVSLSNLLFTTEGTQFLDELDRLRDEAESPGRAETQVVGSTLGIASGLSVGYAFLLTRGGLLLTSLLSSMPAWRLIDPLPVLARLGAAKREDGEEEDESLDSLVRRGAKNEGSEETDPAISSSAGADPGESAPAGTGDGRNQP